MQNRFNGKAMRWAVVCGLLMLLSITSMGYVQAAGLTQDEIDKLVYVREEEKLARDVYNFLSGLYPQARIFSNIAASEQTHMDAIKTLLDRYNIADPALGAGNFTPESGLQEYYDKLTVQGQISLDEAYKVGVAIEEMDIEDLKEGIEISIKHKDITTVYKNLLKGSENHLAAFKYNLK